MGWLLACVYSTIPSYWLVVHPLADFWRTRGAKLKMVGPIWPILWVAAGLVTARWRHRVLYSTPWRWAPALALIAAAFYIYQVARRDFSEDQLFGRSELEPHKHEQRLVTAGIRGRVRHPYYLAHLLHLSGWAIGTGSLAIWALEGFAIMTGAIMLPLEERELVRRFGDDYRSYVSRTSAILPRIKRRLSSPPTS